jgi:hypothetical protein
LDPKYDRDYGWGEVDAFLAKEAIPSAVGGTIMTIDKGAMLVAQFDRVVWCVAVVVVMLAASGYLRRRPFRGR